MTIATNFARKIMAMGVLSGAMDGVRMMGQDMKGASPEAVMCATLESLFSFPSSSSSLSEHSVRLWNPTTLDHSIPSISKHGSCI